MTMRRNWEPVIDLERDAALPPHAYHSAAIVPGAALRVVDTPGHFSIVPEIVGTVCQLLARPALLGLQAAR